jgi:hypothetical protein
MVDNDPERPFDGRRSAAMPLPVFCVSRFPLMPDRQDQHDILGRQPTVLGDVTVPATRQHEFASTVFGHTTEQQVVRQDLECRSYAREPRQRPLGVGLGDEVEQALQVTERTDGSFDARHERARGRRGFLPPILAAR